MPAKKPVASRAATKTPRAATKLGQKTKRATSNRVIAVAPKKTRRGSAATPNRRVAGVLLAGVGVLLSFALFSSGNSGNVNPSPSAKPVVENSGLWQSAVQIAWAVKQSDDTLRNCGGGSGGLVGDITQVLTNQHVINGTQNESDCATATLYVGYPVEFTGTYFVWWPAKVRGSNEFLDLALLDVDMNGAAVVDNSSHPASIVLNSDWPVYSLATDVPLLGAPISIYSYPRIGGYSMTFTAGNVAGWSWDYWSQEDTKGYSPEWVAGYNADSDGYRDYMKLDATVAHGSSGSSVLNANGEIIGVSTLVGVSTSDETVDCSVLADTNDDGEVNDKDTCVPVGGFLNASATLADIRIFLTKQGVTP